MASLIELKGTREELKCLNNLENRLNLGEPNLKKPILILCEEKNHGPQLCYPPIIIFYGGESTNIENYSSNKRIEILAEGWAFVKHLSNSKKCKNKLSIDLITKGDYNPIDELLRKQKKPKIKIKEERFNKKYGNQKHLVYYPHRTSIGEEQISNRLSEIFSHSFQYRNPLI